MDDMYLTRTFINPRRRGAVTFLGNPQKIHAAVMQAFPVDPASDAATGPRVLWRLDSDDHRRPVLWIVSPDKPDLHHVTDFYGWPESGRPFETKDYLPLLNRLAAGQRYVFRVTINPVKSLHPGPEAREARAKVRGKVVPLVGALNQISWFAERAGKWGFELLPGSVPLPDTEPPSEASIPFAVEIRDRKRLRFWRSDSEKKPVTLETVTLEGLMRVTDPQLLRDALTCGVGRARGYGCGLISLAAPQ
ncbi:type I-E CRISPR-associated protein Cas6/Cse3/CasE [Nonomuraea fuscirosea]|uniref:type I-E CRISPR-associated protein Cas6/Cse3/CasE n=1 Tax=Nonomuraea fuscirosea TaxID=1291556 RepID=UPI0033E41E5B